MLKRQQNKHPVMSGAHGKQSLNLLKTLIILATEIVTLTCTTRLDLTEPLVKMFCCRYTSTLHSEDNCKNLILSLCQNRDMKWKVNVIPTVRARKL